MKNIIIFIMTILVLCMCGGCSSGIDDWQTIVIEDCGTIKIPSEWSFYTEDEIMYVMDNDKPIMISYLRSSELESNAYFSDFKYIDFITSAGLSNNPIYGKAKYLYSGNEIERFYLYLAETSDGNNIEFLVWDTEISEELLVKIAKTFILK